jgi:hypothetical protein
VIEALQYAQAGLSIVPLRTGEKRPLVHWGEFQRRRPSATELERWGAAWPDAGIAIVCGRVSSLVVLDEDPRHGGDESLARYPLPVGPIVISGGGGRHFYFAVNGETVPKVAALLPGVDLLGEGSLATAPPSIHPNGHVYRWAPGHAFGEVPLPAVPSWLRGLLSERRRRAQEAAVSFRRSGIVSASLETVLSKLAGVRRSGAGWTARCPAHADHDPSLSVGVGHDGRLLLHCFGGCPFYSVLAALELAV